MVKKLACTVNDCTNPPLRGEQGFCVLCAERLCAAHAQRPTHACPTLDDDDAYRAADGVATRKELKALFAKIDLDALKSHVAALRGVECQISLPSDDFEGLLMGGFNLHLPVTFSDGVEWLVRIPRQHVMQPPPALHHSLLASEISTLKYLKTVGLPVPDVYDVQLSDSNAVHVPFVVYERMAGDTYMWMVPTEAQKAHFITQFARMLVILSDHPFSSIGSLSSDSGRVGPILDAMYVESNDSTFTRMGPFRSAREYHQHVLKVILQDIRDRRRYISCPIDGYIVHLQLLAVVDVLYPAGAASGPFFIKHPDDKGDNFLVDQDFNVAALIDWERTRTCPPEEAFAAPTFTLDVGEFYDGVNTLSTDEATLAQAFKALGRPDLATYVLNGKKYQRFEFCVGGRVEDMDQFWPLFKSLMVAAGLREWASWDEWKAHALQKSVYGSDRTLHELLALRAA